MTWLRPNWFPLSAPAGRSRAAGRRLVLLGLIATLAACPSRGRRPLAPTVPTHGDPAARMRFERAQNEFRNDGAELTDEFAAIAEEFPDDPIAPYARLYAGISAVRDGDYPDAVTRLREVEASGGGDRGLVARTRLYLGIAENYLGDYGAALPHLTAGEEAISDDGERAEWLAAMAEATSHGTDPLGALGYYDRWYSVARPAERSYIVARLRAVVAAAGAADAERAYAALRDRKGPSAAVLGDRVAGDRAAAGAVDRARAIRAETAEARRRIGMAVEPSRHDLGDPSRLGVVLPLSGRRGRVGERALRGLAVASGSFVDDPPAASFALTVRDSESTRSGARDAADALADEGVIALIGPIDGDSVEAVAERAAALGVVELSLNPRSSEVMANSPFVFHMMHSAEHRARALAAYAYRNGVRDFAILGPDNGYGRAVGAAFRAEVERRGGSVVVERWYGAGETSFGKEVAGIKKPWQAVFVPDVARRLELVAPALAAANLVSTPVGAKPPRHGRKILLLSTAEALAPRYLRSAGRYSVGAVLAPGFYPDRFDPPIADFVDRYEEAYGELPAAVDAYGYDAALAVGATVAGGARSRQRLSEQLSRSELVGVTGTVRFGPDRRRADDGLLYRVERRDDTGELAIRAQRQ